MFVDARYCLIPQFDLERIVVDTTHRVKAVLLGDETEEKLPHILNAISLPDEGQAQGGGGRHESLLVECKRHFRSVVIDHLQFLASLRLRSNEILKQTRVELATCPPWRRGHVGERLEQRIRQLQREETPPVRRSDQLSLELQRANEELTRAYRRTRRLGDVVRERDAMQEQIRRLQARLLRVFAERLGEVLREEVPERT